MMDDLQIYMVTHRHAPSPSDPYYLPIQAGAAESESLGILRDDTGDNISSKNKHYCELTALYWIWKNSTAKAVGLVHYRRFFPPKTAHVEHHGQNIASGEDLLTELRTSNLIVSQPTEFLYEGTVFPKSIKQQYSDSHNGFDLLQLRRAIAYVSPEYLPAYDFVLDGNRLLAFNMIVAPKDVFDSYCKWAFQLFLEMEKLIPLESLSGYQARVIGFISERVFTIWAAHNRKDLRFDFRPHVYYDNV